MVFGRPPLYYGCWCEDLKSDKDEQDQKGEELGGSEGGSAGEL